MKTRINKEVTIADGVIIASCTSGDGELSYERCLCNSWSHWTFCKNCKQYLPDVCFDNDHQTCQVCVFVLI